MSFNLQYMFLIFGLWKSHRIARSLPRSRIKNDSSSNDPEGCNVMLDWTTPYGFELFLFPQIQTL